MTQVDVYQQLFLEAQSTRSTNSLFQEISAGVWWKENYRNDTGQNPDKKNEFDEFLKLAFFSPNFSCAFNVGYQFALRRVFADVCPGLFEGNRLVCLCVSESKGNSPKAIETALDTEGLNGFKSFITCSDEVDALLVLFDDQRAPLSNISDGQKKLKIVAIDGVGKSGVKIEASAKAKFLPDLISGKASMENVLVPDDQILSGDGHQDYSKPFSLVEGFYIKLAATALLLRISIHLECESEIQADILTLLVSLRGVVEKDLFSPSSQLVLDSFNRQVEILISRLNAYFDKKVDELDRLAWERDRVVFYIDMKLRATRLDAAWAQLSA